ncbi:MAG: HNH endonuclease [Phycisphaeraceae bacterium]
MFERDPAVQAFVLRRADGVCELCGERTFLMRSTRQRYYLEVHHLVPLSEGGPDTVDNAAGLCPTCHARCHHGVDAEAVTARIRERTGL